MSEYVTPKDGLRREIMGNEHYYHMFANGDDAKDFITNEEEHKAAFNRFEAIYRTHNCFRAFLAGGKDRDKELFRRMANARGVVIEDLQARKLCEECNLRLFGKHSTRHLKTDDRILLSQDLRNRYHLSYRQLSSLVKLPEAELREYVK